MNAPFSEGPLDCKICFIGEAPGQTEEQLRRPFVGSAGQLFDKLLHTAGINRSQCRIENVMQVRPPGNDIGYYIDFGKKGYPRKPEFDEHAAALIERLKGCTANVFVPLGNTPLYVLTGLTAISKRRGSILSSEVLGGRKVIPTVHPSAALRQFLLTHQIGYDLRRVLEQSAFPEVTLPQRELLTMPSYAQVLSFIEDAERHSVIAADIEVKGNEISHISIALNPMLCMSIPFVDGMDDYWTPEQETAIWLRLAHLMENPAVTKVFHNAAFDTAFMYRKMGIRCAPIECSMVAFAILMPDFPKGLDFLTSIYCGGEPYYKDDGKKYMKNPFGSEKTFQEYNAKDSCCCLESWLQIEQELHRQGNWPFYCKQRDLIEPLTFMQEHGIRMDVEGMKKAAEDAGRQIEEYEAELHRLAGFPLNVNSPKQMATYFYGLKGFSPYLKKGSITTDDMAMKRLERKGSKEAKLVRSIRELRKAKGTYYEMGIDDDGRLRCSFNPVGTKSTRLSSSKTIFDTGGNLQNQPKEMLNFMLADPGFLMCKFDLGQAENRVVAYVSNCQRMIEAFETGKDVHCLTAGLIFGIPPDAVSDDEGSCPIGGGAYSQRFWGKKANHGLNYDLGYKTFALYYEIPENEAKYIVERYHSAYPEVRQWHTVLRGQLSKNRTLTDCFGSTRLFTDRWGDELFKEAYSWIPQSSVAKQTNYRGVLPLYYDLEVFRHVHLLNQVHDAIYFQLPLSIGLDEIVRILCAVRDSLQTPLQWRERIFSIPADLAVGFCAGQLRKVKVIDAEHIQPILLEEPR